MPITCMHCTHGEGGTPLNFQITCSFGYQACLVDRAQCLNRTMMQLILSLLPRWNASSVKRFAAFSASVMPRTRSAASWLFMTSQSPSLAKIRNSSSGRSSSSLISGVGMTKRFSGLSPKALDTASTPPTRHVPAQTTTPPALSIRCLSSLAFGLWSTDIATAFPPRHRTALESPTFATSRRCPSTTAVTAVHPSSRFELESCRRYWLSVLSYDSAIALCKSLLNLACCIRLMKRLLRT
mmetsp:Transcript_18067/g.38867  ORF Transcript_18067/g.38867 Transcript_18067/m.38867 type:complete len:239 (-) Transcript_18067:507-1223(-)